MRFIRPKDVLDLVGLSRTTLWRLCRDGAFPRPVRLSAGRSAFVYEAVQEWMEQRGSRWRAHSRARQACDSLGNILGRGDGAHPSFTSR